MFDYIVQPGDTIYSISRQFDLTTAQLLSVNPELRDGRLTIGQTLRIPESRDVRPTIEVNGYAYPTISPDSVYAALPYLTYLSILGYNIQADGTLSSIDDAWLIEAARENGVAPLMVVSNIDPDIGFSSELAHAILSDAALHRVMIDDHHPSQSRKLLRCESELCRVGA